MLLCRPQVSRVFHLPNGTAPLKEAAADVLRYTCEDEGKELQHNLPRIWQSLYALWPAANQFLHRAP